MEEEMEKKRARTIQTRLQSLQHSATSVEARCAFLQHYVAMCEDLDIPLENFEMQTILSAHRVYCC